MVGVAAVLCYVGREKIQASGSVAMPRDTSSTPTYTRR